MNEFELQLAEGVLCRGLLLRRDHLHHGQADDSFRDRYRRHRLLWRKKSVRMTNTGRPDASQLASLPYLSTNAPAEPKRPWIGSRSS
jgi:hypothetical protein